MDVNNSQRGKRIQQILLRNVSKTVFSKTVHKSQVNVTPSDGKRIDNQI